MRKKPIRIIKKVHIYELRREKIRVMKGTNTKYEGKKYESQRKHKGVTKETNTNYKGNKHKFQRKQIRFIKEINEHKLRREEIRIQRMKIRKSSS